MNKESPGIPHQCDVTHKCSLNFALRATGMMLEALPDMLEVRGRNMAVVLVIPLGCPASVGRKVG